MKTNETTKPSRSDAPPCSALNDTPTPKTDAIEHACNRLHLVLDYIKMRDHAKELERQLQQAKDALHGAHKDRLADAQERRADNARWRDALEAARKHILERNGLCKDSDRRAAIAINTALSPNANILP